LQKPSLQNLAIQPIHHDMGNIEERRACSKQRPRFLYDGDVPGRVASGLEQPPLCHNFWSLLGDLKRRPQEMGRQGIF